MRIVVSEYMCNLSAVRRITKESLRTYPDITPGRGPADYVLAWGDPVHKCKYGVIETGFFWDAMHIDTVGLYSSCSLNSAFGIKSILQYKSPRPARDVIFGCKFPESKYKQVSNKVSWDGVVLPLQNPTDRSIHRGSSTEDYYDFVKMACKKYGKNLFLKLHPWNKGDVERRFTEYANENGCTIGRCDHSVLEKCKFAIAYNSTFVVDCLIRNVPVAQYATGYFWQVPGVYYTSYEFPDHVCFNEDLAQKTCDFLVWRYCFNQGMSIDKWVGMIRHFAASKEIFPMTEEYSYG
ncbi:MAG: hypothetical protein GF411_08455, partial [Candidatus Lokiarchaeota archaeon]|nr:hypothetical protein [Candidatus Lokiarchaeota archaeon]